MKNILTLSLLCLCAVVFAGSNSDKNVQLPAKECDDSGVCRLPGSTDDTQKNGVLSPAGKYSIKQMKQARRRLPPRSGDPDRLGYSAGLHTIRV